MPAFTRTPPLVTTRRLERARARFTARPARLLGLLLVLCATLSAWQPPALPPPRVVADGVALFQLSDPELLSPPGPVCVQALRLDPRLVRIETAVPGDITRPAGKATVPEIAARHGALAAINAGFFVVSSGRPAGLLKVGGRLVSGSSLARGAVAFIRPSGRRPMRLVFDQVSATRAASPPRPARYLTRFGTRPARWATARAAVGGAGLLLRDGRHLTLDDWAVEQLQPSFVSTRHPRTMIGVDKDGSVWLVTVDGRNPAISLGMTFRELQGLANRLGLRDALNLDGGGSTTMVVRGEVTNHPSDLTGPRPVSDAILVFPRQ